MPNVKRSYRGNMVNIDELSKKNSSQMSIGNMNVNARGDELDENGNVIRKHDDITREHNKNFSTTSTNASIISEFEDEDDDMNFEIKDDPKVLNKNSNKSTSSQNNKSTSKNDETKPSSEDLD